MENCDLFLRNANVQHGVLMCWSSMEYFDELNTSNFEVKVVSY